MKCKKAMKMAILYLDRELGLDEENMVSNHLKICPSCRREFDLLEKSLGIYQEIEKGEQLVDHSPGLISKLRERMEKEVPWWQRLFVTPAGHAWRLVYVSAAAAIVLLSFVFLHSISNPSLYINIARGSKLLSGQGKTYLFGDGVAVYFNHESYVFKERQGNSFKSIDMKV